MAALSATVSRRQSQPRDSSLKGIKTYPNVFDGIYIYTNLTSIIFQGDVHRCHLEGEATSHPIEQCLKSCKIKVVELYPETTFNIVVGMVELFLGRLRWLEQFKVYCHVIDAGSEELVKRIMAQPKASPNCKFQMLPIII